MVEDEVVDVVKGGGKGGVGVREEGMTTIKVVIGTIKVDMGTIKVYNLDYITLFCVSVRVLFFE